MAAGVLERPAPGEESEDDDTRIYEKLMRANG